MILPFPVEPYAPRRRPTREVRIGDVAVGGANPIRIQSMTTTATRDVRATAEQARRLAAAGCEIVRVTAPTLRDAEALREIRAALDASGVRIPLVADIHFTPRAALIAAEHVEKVRINPGNYADKKRFEVREYDDAEYAAEVERVAERFRPLVHRCRELGRALRIGTNHGSLSDRILNRYGDTPRGMVESALEFLDVCEQEGFHDILFSMKASNPQVVVQAYRLLAARLAERSPEGPGYPFHLGVTEAGDGEEGRIKSAIGIGALLEDGLGDTIRVSLTEDPVNEVPVARALARRYEARWAEPDAAPGPSAASLSFPADPYAYARRATQTLVAGGVELGGARPVRVELELGPAPEAPEPAAHALADAFARRPGLACEGTRVEGADASALDRARRFGRALADAGVEAPLALRLPAALAAQAGAGSEARWIVPVAAEGGADPLAAAARAARRSGVALEWSLRGSPAQLVVALQRVLDLPGDAAPDRLLVSAESPRPVHAARLLAAGLRARARDGVPIVLRPAQAAPGPGGKPTDGSGVPLLAWATDLGAPLCDGIGDAVALPAGEDPATTLALAYRILQGARLRTSWTEFISCPSCGRTQFDLEETTARIKARTQHLAGVKIAVMGCIVNGPGEMADADFGYVGSGPGLVNLYVGRECVERHVPAEEADDRLVELIRKHGRWADPV